MRAFLWLDAGDSVATALPPGREEPVDTGREVACFPVISGVLADWMNAADPVPHTLALKKHFPESDKKACLRRHLSDHQSFSGLCPVKRLTRL